MNTHPRPREPERSSLEFSNPKRARWVIATGILLLLLLALLAERSRADFGLTVSLSSTNTLFVTISNANTNVAYQLDRTPSLEPNFLVWTPHLFGVPGQTSFTVNIGITDPQGFLRSLPCVDCDQDGIENWRDASPYDTNVGLLSITIESPANGSAIQ